MRNLLLSAFAILLCSHLFGQTWNPVSSGATQYLYTIDFADDMHGWAAGDFGTIVATSDGGATWSPQTSNTTQNFRDIHFVDNSNGFAVGYSGTLLRTQNGGSTWTTVSLSSSELLRRVTFSSATNGWIVGENGSMFRTTDGGATWNAIASNTIDHLYDILFTSPANGYAFTRSSILESTDGGMTWAYDTITPTFYKVNRVILINSNEMIAVTVDGKVVSSIVGSHSWTIKDSLADVLRGIDFLNSQTGWVVGTGNSGPEIYKTTDGGNTWTGETESSPLNEAFAVAILSSGVGFVVGQNGKMVTNGTTVDVREVAVAASNGVSVFPNPTHQDMTIDGLAPGEYTVLNTLGQEMLRFAGRNQYRLDVSDWPQGIYYLRSSALKQAVRFVKE